MKDSEQAIDKVLHGLRGVKAPAGMEHRILLAMERRAARPAHIFGRRMLSFAPVRVAARGAFACAGLMGVVLWVATLHRSGPKAAVGDSAAARLAQEQAAESASMLPRTAQPSFRRAKVVQRNALSESDALALEEMRARSQPAPPLPLTEQEKLLLRVARRHDPDQMAMLNPEVRSKQELQAKVEFQEFFEPTRPAAEKPHTESTEKKGDTR